MNKLFVVGSVNVDLTIETQRMVEKGETIRGQHFQQLHGGKGANQAIAASCLGATVHLVANIGCDTNGQLALQNLEQFHVDTTYVNGDENNNTGVAIIIKSEQDNRIILDLGANDTLSHHTVENALQHVTPEDIVLCQLENPLDVVGTALRLGKEKGALTVLNPAPAQSLPNQLYADVDVIVVNETEANILTGILPETNEDIDKIARFFYEKGIKEVVVTLGDKGSYWLCRDEKIYTPACRVNVVDTTGAGDSFIGSFLAKRLEKQSIAASLNYASHVAAFMCALDGAQSTKLSDEAIGEFIEKMTS